MKKRHIAPIAALGISLTYISADLTGLIPPSRIDALTEFGLRSLFVSGSGKTKAQWLQHDRQNFSCFFEEKEYGYYCGFDIKVGDGREHGRDLSNYTHLQIKLVFLGDGDYVRIIFRNAFDDISVAPEGKQQDVLQPVKRGLNELSLPLDSFTVPQYWIVKHLDLNESHLSSDRSNVTHMGLFYEEPNAIGEHEFRVKEFVVTNKWQDLVNKIAYMLFPIALSAIAMMRAFQYMQNRTRGTDVNPYDEGDIRLECERLIAGQASDVRVYDIAGGLLSHDMTCALLKRYAEKYSLSKLAIVAISLDKYDQVKSQFGVEAASQYQLTASIAVKLSVGKQGVACSWRQSQILVFLPHVAASRGKKITAEIRRQALVAAFSERNLPLDLSISVRSASSLEDFFAAFEQVQNAR